MKLTLHLEVLHISLRNMGKELSNFVVLKDEIISSYFFQYLHKHLEINASDTDATKEHMSVHNLLYIEQLEVPFDEAVVQEIPM